jgi:hypothetical protein
MVYILLVTGMDRRTESLVSLADYLQSFLHFVASHSLSLSLSFLVLCFHPYAALSCNVIISLLLDKEEANK